MTTREENRESDISHHLCAGLTCSCDTHSDSTICGTLARKILAFNEVDRRELALAIDPSLSPPEPTEGQAKAHEIAIALCLVDGRDPDAEAPLSEMTDEANMAVPWWMTYVEYAESLLGKFDIRPRAMPLQQETKP